MRDLINNSNLDVNEQKYDKNKQLLLYSSPKIVIITLNDTIQNSSTPTRLIESGGFPGMTAIS